MKTQFSTFNAADYLDDEEIIAEYLSAMLITSAQSDRNKRTAAALMRELNKATQAVMEKITK